MTRNELVRWPSREWLESRVRRCPDQEPQSEGGGRQQRGVVRARVGQRRGGGSKNDKVKRATHLGSFIRSKGPSELGRKRTFAYSTFTAEYEDFMFYVRHPFANEWKSRVGTLGHCGGGANLLVCTPIACVRFTSELGFCALIERNEEDQSSQSPRNSCFSVNRRLDKEQRDLRDSAVVRLRVCLAAMLKLVQTLSLVLPTLCVVRNKGWRKWVAKGEPRESRSS